MKFIKGTIEIPTKFKDDNLKDAAQTVCDWADQMNFYCELGWNEDNKYICNYSITGRTITFCKGMAAEFKNIVSSTFRCKVKTLLEMW